MANAANGIEASAMLMASPPVVAGTLDRLTSAPHAHALSSHDSPILLSESVIYVKIAQ